MIVGSCDAGLTAIAFAAVAIFAFVVVCDTRALLERELRNNP